MRRLKQLTTVSAPSVAAVFALGAAPAAAKGGAAGNCGPPGQTIKFFAQGPGSTVDAWLGPPGQSVREICAPGHQGGLEV